MQDDMITSATATGTTSRDTPHRLIASNRVQGSSLSVRSDQGGYLTGALIVFGAAGLVGTRSIDRRPA